MKKRDPRINPIPGDILRIGGTFGGSWYEVLLRDPQYNRTDVSYICDGVEVTVSLGGWQLCMKQAEVIRVAKEI